MVSVAGLEPASLSAPHFECGVFTIFTIPTGLLGRTRTCSLFVRSEVLYPIGLRGVALPDGLEPPLSGPKPDVLPLN